MRRARRGSSRRRIDHCNPARPGRLPRPARRSRAVPELHALDPLLPRREARLRPRLAWGLGGSAGARQSAPDLRLQLRGSRSGRRHHPAAGSRRRGFASRWDLDHLFRAERRGVRKTAVSSLRWDGDRVVGVLRACVAAVRVGDGRRSSTGAADQVREPATRAMYYRYVRGFTNPDGAEPDGAEFSLRDDELLYAFPSDDGTTCVAVSVNLEDFAVMRRDAESGFHERLGAHRGSPAAVHVDGSSSDVDPRITWSASPSEPDGPWSGTRRSTRTLGRGSGWTTPAFTRRSSPRRSTIGSGRLPEDEAFARYHARRDEHAMADFRETVELGRDLRQLASA